MSTLHLLLNWECWPMGSIVEELTHEACDSTNSVSDMLRKVRVVAVKLELTQAVKWVELELNGYNRGNQVDDIPEYRTVVGQARARNPFHGWQPLMFGDKEFEKTVTQFTMTNPIRQIEDYASRNEHISTPMNGQQVQILCEIFGCPVMPMSIFFASTHLVGIIDAVRNKVLDWSLSLQQKGIRGDGLSFRPEEKAVAQDSGNTFNIGNIASFAGNIGGAVGGDVNGSNTQNFGGEVQKVAELVRQLRDLQDKMGLSLTMQAELKTSLAELDAESRKLVPQPGNLSALLKSIKGIAESAGGNLVSAGVLAAISAIHL